jgi:hypothetical protein
MPASVIYVTGGEMIGSIGSDFQNRRVKNARRLGDIQPPSSRRWEVDRWEAERGQNTPSTIAPTKAKAI